MQVTIKEDKKGSLPLRESLVEPLYRLQLIVIHRRRNNE